MMTSRYSHKDKCLKSTLTFLQADAGNGHICNSSRVVLGVAIWHDAPQDVVFFSIMLFMFREAERAVQTIKNLLKKRQDPYNS